ncbi:MAG: sterol desaturase family protein [Acidimicrobiales bacterium]
MESRSVESGVARATETSTLSSANTLFWRFGSPRIMVVGLMLAVAIRVALLGRAPVGRWDLAAIAIVAALIPFVEWFIHLVVLHATPRRIGSLTVDPGQGHREHHQQPASIDRVLLRGFDAALFQAINAAVVVIVVGGPVWLFAGGEASSEPGSGWGPVLTGVIAAFLALFHYEWSHFLFHTAYRPKTRYYRRLKSNHRLHHWRNERYWLGITTNLADRVLGTHPESRSAVPASPTVKTLGVDPEADHSR